LWLVLPFSYQFLSPFITVHHRQKPWRVLRRELFQVNGIIIGFFCR